MAISPVLKNTWSKISHLILTKEILQMQIRNTNRKTQGNKKCKYNDGSPILLKNKKKEEFETPQ